MSKNNTLHVGIDVSSKKLDMAFMHNGKWVQTEFANIHKSHASMVRYLKKCSNNILVCVEATGIYHLELSLALRGKTPMQGVVAVMRKRLHSIYGVLKNNTPYDSRLFYQNIGNVA